MGFNDIAKEAKVADFAAPILKEDLLDTPFIITGIEFKHSENLKSDYVQCTLLLEDDTVRTMSDGSTGIKAQLEKLLEENGGDISDILPMLVKGGLRKSTYTNQFGENTTFYLAS